MSATQEQRWPILEGIALTGFGTSAVLTRELKDVLREEAQSLLAARDALLREREELSGRLTRLQDMHRVEHLRAETSAARVAELEAQLQAEQGQTNLARAELAEIRVAVRQYDARDLPLKTVDIIRDMRTSLAASEEARKRAEEKLARLRETVRRAHSLLIHVEDVERYSGWDAIKKARALLAEADQKGEE